MIRKGQARWVGGKDVSRQNQFIDTLFDLPAQTSLHASSPRGFRQHFQSCNTTVSVLIPGRPRSWGVARRAANSRADGLTLTLQFMGGVHEVAFWNVFPLQKFPQGTPPMSLPLPSTRLLLY